MIHYCSSDYFLGSGTVSSMVDSANETIYHHGIANTMAVLKYTAAQQESGEFFSGMHIISHIHELNITFLESWSSISPPPRHHLPLVCVFCRHPGQGIHQRVLSGCHCCPHLAGSDYNLVICSLLFFTHGQPSAKHARDHSTFLLLFVGVLWITPHA